MRPHAVRTSTCSTHRLPMIPRAGVHHPRFVEEFLKAHRPLGPVDRHTRQASNAHEQHGPGGPDQDWSGQMDSPDPAFLAAGVRWTSL